MSEFKQENGYVKASNVGAKSLDGTIPGIGKIQGSGTTDIRAAFFAPHADIPGIKVSAATAALKSEAVPAQAPQAKEPATVEPVTQSPERLSAAKPELKVPEPPKAKTPIIVPAALAPVVAAGILSGFHREQAHGRDKPGALLADIQDRAAFDPNLSTPEAVRARQQQKLREQLAERDSKQDSNRDLMELYAQEQQNQFQRQMNNFINEEMDRLREEKARREQRVADLDRQIEQEGRTRAGIATALDGNRTRMRLTEEKIQKLYADGKITEEKLKELQEKLRLKNKEIEDNKTKIQTAGQAVDKAKEDARKAESESAQAGQEKKALTQAKDIYQQNIDIQNEKIKLLTAEIKQNEAKLLKDANGNAVYKDEKGNLYTKAADGSKNTLSDSEQQVLKEKMAAEGLVTQDTIDEKNKQLATEQENLKGYEEGKRLAQELKEQAEQKQAEAERNKLILGAVTTDAESDLAAHRKKQDELIKEKNELEDKIKETKDRLDKVNKDILSATKDKETLLAEQKQLEKDLKASEEREAVLRQQRIEEIKEIKRIENDMKALTTLSERMNDPEMKKRLDSNDKNVREAAYKELYDSAPPRLQARIKEQYEEFEKKRQATAQASPAQPQAAAQQSTQPVQTQSAQAQTPQAAVASVADNTSRTGGSAAETVVKASTEVGPPFATAAAGVTPQAPEAEPAPDQALVASNTQRSTARNNLGTPSA